MCTRLRAGAHDATLGISGRTCYNTITIIAWVDAASLPFAWARHVSIMNLPKQILLDQISADILKNNVCPDLAKTATHLVMGEGSPNADIVFIGEAPGKKEDESGKPFVGPSGRFLTELLESVGLDRKDVFITSIVKYRPPNNRDPKPEEKAAFLPYLLRQLEVINPKLIVTLGRHGMSYFVPDQTITQVHGTLITGGTWPVLPLFHPAAALYNHNIKQTIVNDFKKVPQALTQIEGNSKHESK